MKKLILFTIAFLTLTFTVSAQTPTTISGKPITLNSDSSIIFKINNVPAGVIYSGTNMSLGYQSLPSNTTGINNTAVGNRSLFSNTTGFRNIGLGTQAGEGITTGTEDISIGYQSMQPDYNNVTGNRNVAVGNHSMFGNSSSPSVHSGNDNTAVGHVALGGEIDGNFNVALGSGSLRNHTNGSYNTSVGGTSLYSSTTGNYNTGIGGQSLYYNNGNGNTAVGLNSIYLSTTGSHNTAVGFETMQNGNGSFNICIGDSAGFNESGSYKFHLGIHNSPYLDGDMTTGAKTLTISAVTSINGDVSVQGGISVIGGIKIPTGTNSTIGQTNLTSGGTQTIYTTAVHTNSLIFISVKSMGTLKPAPFYTNIVDGVSFDIIDQDPGFSTANLYNWLIINQP